MSVFGRGRLRAVRWAIGLGALLAFPVAGAGVAQASGIGNALHPVFANRPVLDHVNILSGVNAGRSQFCFDKTISLPNPGNPVNFRLGGYRWDTFLNAAPGTQAVLDSTGKCAIVTMTPNGAGGQQDLFNYTIGTVDFGAVTANQSGGAVNDADSTPNVDSVTKSGTRGLTTGFNLQSIITGSPAGTNEIIYVGDKNIDPTTVIPGRFEYYNQNGVLRTGVSAQVSNDPNGGQSFVRVQFALPSGETTQSAAVADIFSGNGPNNNISGGKSNGSQPATWAPTLSVDNPACASSGCATVIPKLVSTEISGSNTIDYTYDQNVTVSNQFGFKAVTSNGDETMSTAATALTSNPKVVRATFSGPNVANYLEEVVVGSENDSVVRSSNNVFNMSSGKPTGDNTGGKAPGYTNGPDATLLTLLKGVGQMTVQFDQRVAANSAGQPVGPDGTTLTPLADWIALNGNGDPVGTPTSATVEHVSAFIDQVRLGGFNPTLIDQGVVKALAIVGNQYCSNGNAAVTNGTCGQTTGNPYSNGYTGQSTNPNAPGTGNMAAVFTFGNPHGTGTSGMNPAGNVEQIIAPASTMSVVRLVKHRHWVKAGHKHHKKHH